MIIRTQITRKSINVSNNKLTKMAVLCSLCVLPINTLNLFWASSHYNKKWLGYSTNKVSLLLYSGSQRFGQCPDCILNGQINLQDSHVTVYTPCFLKHKGYGSMMRHLLKTSHPTVKKMFQWSQLLYLYPHPESYFGHCLSPLSLHTDFRNFSDNQKW